MSDKVHLCLKILFHSFCYLLLAMLVTGIVAKACN